MEQITEEKFLQYESVRLSGETNMWAVGTVVKLAQDYAQNLEELTEEDCKVIMKNYAALAIKYAPAVTKLRQTFEDKN